jgi:hypothetical protein
MDRRALQLKINDVYYGYFGLTMILYKNGITALSLSDNAMRTAGQIGFAYSLFVFH